VQQRGNVFEKNARFREIGNISDNVANGFHSSDGEVRRKFTV
jgi:hypothetical protein